MTDLVKATAAGLRGWRVGWRRGSVDIRALAGAVLLAMAAASVVVLPAGWITIALAGLATIGLAASRRLGWLGAGLLVLLAIPFGRGADVAPFTVADLPVRPQDAVIAIAGLGALASVRWSPDRGRPMLIAIGLWVVLGASALAIGMADGHGLRDIFRDVRWWGLYLVAAIAILGGARRDQLVRGLVLGATALAVVIIAASLLPPFVGGLKAMVLQYDVGTLRMQFGNSAMLVVASGFLAWKAARTRRPVDFGWVALLVTAQMLSLTRVSIIATFVVVALAVAAYIWTHASARRAAAAARVIGSATLALVVAFGAGIGVGVLAVPPPAAGGPPAGENPLDRITFTDDRSDIGTVVGSTASGGRLATYVNAIAEIRDVPLIGRGMGSLVAVAFAYSEARAATKGRQPGVDNAYLTAALKAGVPGALTMAAIFVLPLWGASRRRHMRVWYLPAWLGLGAMTMTQSFAVSSYGPFAVALLAALPFLGYAASRRSAARDQE